MNRQQLNKPGYYITDSYHKYGLLDLVFEDKTQAVYKKESLLIVNPELKIIITKIKGFYYLYQQIKKEVGTMNSINTNLK
jgi:hypothetical protein